ncbi:hypothetical protein [Clostridium sp. JN-1]|uniref:hypothetical protein n=1 Tax=Clostridium sp. JN-1 TaxID=2483110 RepID=UPI001FAABAF7|nr:hypothetical protein [Clostridium sp. JN-1]
MYYSDFDYMRSDDHTNSQDENFEITCPFSLCPFAYQARGFVDMPRVNPPGPPPAFTPTKKSAGPSLKAVDPGAIRPCRNRFVYIWQTDGRSYWAYITFVGPRSIAGFRWIPRTRRWTYFGLDLRRIESFFCA